MEPGFTDKSASRRSAEIASASLANHGPGAQALQKGGWNRHCDSQLFANEVGAGQPKILDSRPGRPGFE